MEQQSNFFFKNITKESKLKRKLLAKVTFEIIMCEYNNFQCKGSAEFVVITRL